MAWEFRCSQGIVHVSARSQANFPGKRNERQKGPALLQGDQLAPNTDAFTVVILGVPRGGTTMVAGVAQRCGLFIGDNLPANLEDQRFVRNDASGLDEIVSQSNQQRSVWGWKYPRAADYLSELLPKLRNPRLVMIWRDPLAIASRGVSRGDTVERSLRRVASLQSQNIRLIQEARCPILHVSYEKAISDPLPFIESLATFIGGSPPADMQELLAFMEPGSYKPVQGEQLSAPRPAPLALLVHPEPAASSTDHGDPTSAPAVSEEKRERSGNAMPLKGKTLILGVGAQRCGTTWLHDYLSGHPQIFASPIKEMHFFDAHLGVQDKEKWTSKFDGRLQRFARRDSVGDARELRTALEERAKMHDDPSTYLEYFSSRAGDKPFLCEITPSYGLLSAEQFKWVKDFFAPSGVTLKLVFLMRDPIDRHRSFAQLRARGSGRSVDFLRSLSLNQAVARGRYDLVLERLRSVFEPEQIITAFYEDIFANPDIHLRKIMDRVGIEYIEPKIAERKNAAPPRETPLTESEISAAMTVFRPVYEYVNREFAREKPATWRA